MRAITPHHVMAGLVPAINVLGGNETCARVRFFLRWLGLAKASLQIHLTAIAYNLRRAWRLMILAPA